MLERARLLINQSRYDLAEKELRQYLARNMGDPEGHAMLAFCLNQQKKTREALTVIRQSIALDPDYPFNFYVMALVNISMKDLKAARLAIEQAIHQDPENSSFHGLLALIYLEAQQWEKALQSANEGLGHDPNDQECLNYRSTALTKLKRPQEAADTIRQSLRENPQDEYAHANSGLAALHRGDHQKALEHFSEALRINPNMEWARSGLVEALKAKYWIYRILLQFFLWMSTLPVKLRSGLIIGAFILVRILRGLSRTYPDLQPFITPIVVCYAFLAFLTWIIAPMFNWILSFNQFGRQALSRIQRIQGRLFGIFFLATVISLITGLIFHVNTLFLLAAFFGFMIIPATNVFDEEENRLSLRATVFTILLGLVGAGGIIAAILEQKPVAVPLLGIFFLGFVIYTLAGSVLGLRKKTV